MSSRCRLVQWMLFASFVVLRVRVNCDQWEGSSYRAENIGKHSQCRKFGSKHYPSPKRINENCFTGKGHQYHGSLNVSKNGKPCINWRRQGQYYYRQTRRRYGIGDHNYCRNPDPSDSGGPWCFVGMGVYSRCDILPCNQYVYDPLNNEPTRTCDQGQIEFIYPDLMYSFRGDTFHATRDKDVYKIYKFSGGDLSSLAEPPMQTSAKAWNLCTQRNDTPTFVTTYNHTCLFIYFEKPDVMIKVRFGPNPVWTELDKRIYQNCTLEAKPAFVSNSYTAIRQVHSMNEPGVVFLLSNDRMVRCEWKNGILAFVNATKSPFGICPSGKLHFINRENKLFQLYDSTLGKLLPSDGNSTIIRSSTQAVNLYPALAAVLLGYNRLNNKSLVRIRIHDGGNNPCQTDGTRARIFQSYNGSELDAAMKWVKKTTHRDVWIRLHDINIRKSSFCEHPSDDSCCSEIVGQALRVNDRSRRNLPDLPQGECDNDLFFILCKISFGSSGCPSVHCLTDDEVGIIPGEKIICEINTAEDPPCAISLENMVNVNDGRIHYKDLSQAMSVIDAISASIGYQNKNDTQTLATLVDSVEALQDVDYNELSESGAQNLISDVVKIVDNIVDQETSDVWSSLQRDDKDANDTVLDEPSANNNDLKKKSKSPSEILFTMESVLSSIVSSNNLAKDNAPIKMKFEEKNVISSIQRMDEYQGDKLVEFDCPGNSSKAKRVAIVSKYPRLMKLISDVDRGQGEGQEQYCEDEECDVMHNLEYIENSPVISASVIEGGRKISSGVTFTIPYFEEDIPDPKSRNSKFYFSCRYLARTNQSMDPSNWDEGGCKVTKVDSEEKVVHCSCNHTTNFAILLQVVPSRIPRRDLRNLRIISYIGETISVICLFITLTVFILFRESLKSARMVAHFHLALALIIFHSTQLSAVFAEKMKNVHVVPCIIVAALTHFSLLASFLWMLVEGILLYISVVSVFQTMKFMSFPRYVIGWAIPGLISVITIAVGLTRNPYPVCYVEGVGEETCPLPQYGSDAQRDTHVIEWCWLSSSSSIVWAMVGPAIIAILINLFILTRVTIVIAKTAKSRNMYRPTTERKKDQHLRKCVRGAIILMPILGVPWIFGLVPQAPNQSIMLYVFAILNSIQGFFIFLFHCLLSSEVRSAFAKYIRKKNLLHSQNFSSHTNGDKKSEGRRGRKRSRSSNATDNITSEEKRRSKSSRPSSACEEKRIETSTFIAK